MSELLRATIALQEDSIQMQEKENERLTAEVDEYQQREDEIIVALGSSGILPSEIVKEIERLTAEGKRKDAVIETAQQLRKTLNSTLTQYTGDIFDHIRTMETALKDNDAT